MIAFLIYQLKVAVVAAVFFLVYKLCLSKQTFHGFNRAMLLLIVVLSFILPLCNIGTNRMVNNVRDALHLESIAIESVTARDSQPVAATEAIGEPDSEDAGQSSEITAADGRRTVATVLFIIWCMGFLYLLGRKAVSLISIRRVINDGRYQDRKDECDLIENDRLAQPMNWMSYVLMPKEWLEKENKAVWNHEMLHARKSHSLDFLLIDVMQLFQWFNPVMILIYKEIELIHEYQADRAVLESGADAYQYKLMLVEAVAGNHGYAMTSWLRQTNLKKRIDMMQKNESNRWNRLRALFIPLLAAVFAVLNTAMTSAQDKNFHWDPFQDGKTWVYEDGTAKVQTVDGVQASMKTTEVAGYLAKYKPVKTTRMTLRYMYNVDDLNVAYPLARSLADKGIHVSIANNDDMLTEMTMPEYRTPAIYDLGDGQFRFEVNCTQKRDVHLNKLKESGVNIFTQTENKIAVVNPSVTGTLDKVMEWIDLFDGHGLAIYPKDMTTKQVDRIAKAVWKRGLDQVSVVTDSIIPGTYAGMMPCDYKLVYIVPKNYSFEKEFGNIGAMDAVKKKHAAQTSAYTGKGIHVQNPRLFYSNDWQVVTDVINAPDELILVVRINQGAYQWVIGMSDCEIEVDGVRYRQTRSEGMEGFESSYFWSPDFGYFYQTLHFPPVPENAKMLNLYAGNDPNYFFKQLQITGDDDIFDKVRTIRYHQYGLRYLLQTTHVNDDQKDEFNIERVDFTDSETTVYCNMYVRAAHSFPGYVSSDFKVTFADGREIKPLRIEGVPLDQDFDRHGDWVANYIQIVLPAISEYDWKHGGPVLHGSVLHEPFSMRINDAYRIYEKTFAPLKELGSGEYFCYSKVVSGQNILYETGEKIYLNLPEVDIVRISRNGSEYVIRGYDEDDNQINELRMRISDKIDTVSNKVMSDSEKASQVEITTSDGKHLKAYGLAEYHDEELADINIILGDDVVMVLQPVKDTSTKSF